MKELFIKILRFLMFVLVVALGCIGYNIYEDTLAAVWIPVGVGLVVAVVTLPLYKKWIWLTTMEQKAVNILCHVVCVGVISCSLFLVGNYQMAAPASTKEVTVTVLEKLIKEHEKRRKVGKHRYVSDGVRKEYYLKVAFEDGAIETLHVSTATYNKARKRQTESSDFAERRFRIAGDNEGAIVFIPPCKTSDEELNALLKDFCVQNVRQSKWWHGVL